jgi:hypothetical protein
MAYEPPASDCDSDAQDRTTVRDQIARIRYSKAVDKFDK